MCIRDRFVPLTPELIDEGEFLDDFALELAEAQRTLANFRKKHGDKSLKAKVKLSVDIELSIASVEDAAYAIKTSIKVTNPKRPASVSLAIEGQTDDNKMALFVRASGSDTDNPRQGKLTTRDGRVIDSETGAPVLESGDEDDAEDSDTKSDGKTQASGE